MTREPIYAALFAFFAGLTSGGSPLFKTATRRPSHWEQVPAEDQPALLLRPRNEIAEHVKFRPTKWVINFDLLVYVNTGASTDDSVIPSQMLNPLLDAIEGALQPDDSVTGTCTLGGLVSYAAPHGATDIHLGSLGDEAVAVVPIRVLVNA